MQCSVGLCCVGCPLCPDHHQLLRTYDGQLRREVLNDVFGCRNGLLTHCCYYCVSRELSGVRSGDLYMSFHSIHMDVRDAMDYVHSTVS